MVLHREFPATPAAPDSRCISWPACCRGWPSARRAGARPQRDAGASQFRQEAGLRGGDPARQPGGLGAGQRVVRRGAVLRLSAGCRATACRCTVLWLPVLLVPQMLFTAGVSWFLAALGVFVRDLGQIIGFLLTIWFFITPICYPEEHLHAAAAVALQESDLRAGARLPRHFSGTPRAGVRAVVEAVAAVGDRSSCWATPGFTSCANRSRI